MKAKDDDNLALFGADQAPSLQPSDDIREFGFSTVLDAKQGMWQERKRVWVSLGIKSEESRDHVKTYSSSGFLAEAIAERGGETSIFDPVLCDLLYKWFCPPGGQVLDPFCGGSVRGIVASKLGLDYWGADLRPEQIRANIEQAIGLGCDPRPVFCCGDSAVVVEREAPESDFIFSCPPYGDLEVYSEDPADISNMDEDDFHDAYYYIIAQSVMKLKENRFACFVVGDYRDKQGFYQNFVSQTINAFEARGAYLYEEAILCTPVGTACMRVTKQFNASRKLAKTHQNILVFCLGNPDLAWQACHP